jgi:hypothetical protein
MQQPPIKILNRNAALGSEEGGKPAQASESIEQSTGCRRLVQTPDDGNRIGNHFKYAQRGKNQIKPTDNRHHQILEIHFYSLEDLVLIPISCGQTRKHRGRTLWDQRFELSIVSFRNDRESAKHLSEHPAD